MTYAELYATVVAMVDEVCEPGTYCTVSVHTARSSYDGATMTEWGAYVADFQGSSVRVEHGTPEGVDALLRLQLLPGEAPALADIDPMVDGGAS